MPTVKRPLPATRLRNAEVLVAMGMSALLLKRCSDSNDKYLAGNQRATDVSGRLGAIAKVLRITVLSSVLAVDADLLVHQESDAGNVLARAIASDLSLYNEEKIVGGVTHDNLFDSLAEEIEEGRALYKRRVSPELYPKNFYDRALVDILVKAKGHIKSKIW